MRGKKKKSHNANIVMMVFGDQERREVMSMTDSALQCSVNNIGEEQ